MEDRDYNSLSNSGNSNFIVRIPTRRLISIWLKVSNDGDATTRTVFRLPTNTNITTTTTNTAMGAMIVVIMEGMLKTPLVINSRGWWSTNDSKGRIWIHWTVSWHASWPCPMTTKRKGKTANDITRRSLRIIWWNRCERKSPKWPTRRRRRQVKNNKNKIIVKRRLSLKIIGNHNRLMKKTRSNRIMRNIMRFFPWKRTPEMMNLTRVIWRQKQICWPIHSTRCGFWLLFILLKLGFNFSSFFCFPIKSWTYRPRIMNFCRLITSKRTCEELRRQNVVVPMVIDEKVENTVMKQFASFHLTQALPKFHTRNKQFE